MVRFSDTFLTSLAYFELQVLGLVIGALFVSYASWPWVFYFIAIVGVLEAVLVHIVCPEIKREHASVLEKARRFKRLDLIGVGAFTGEIPPPPAALLIHDVSFTHFVHLRGHLRFNYGVGSLPGHRFSGSLCRPNGSILRV
jgi:MFS family permease